MQNKLQHILQTNLQLNGLNSKSTVIIGVSGGSDSIALLMAAHFLGMRVFACHINFGLRGEESQADMQYVVDLCAKYTIRLDVLEAPQAPKSDIQDWARDFRYSIFENKRIEHAAEAILVAHHANDQLETLLFQWSRASLNGSNAGMAMKRGHIVRPFLLQPKSELLNFLNQNEISFREDTSNSSLKYTRNKVRSKVIPILEEIFPACIENATQTSVYMQAAILIWQQQSSRIKNKISRKTPEGIVFDDAKLQKFPTQVIHTILSEIGIEHGFSKQVYAQLQLITERSKYIESETHRFIRLDKSWLLCERSLENQAQVFAVLDLMANEWTFDTGVQILVEYVQNLPKDFEEQAKCVYLDAEKLQEVFVRRRREGDYLHLLGSGKKKKLKQALNELKIPLPQRERVRVICSGDAIVWVPGVRVNAKFVANEKTKKIVKLSIK